MARMARINSRIRAPDGTTAWRTVSRCAAGSGSRAQHESSLVRVCRSLASSASVIGLRRELTRCRFRLGCPLAPARGEGQERIVRPRPTRRRQPTRFRPGCLPDPRGSNPIPPSDSSRATVPSVSLTCTRPPAAAPHPAGSARARRRSTSPDGAPSTPSGIAFRRRCSPRACAPWPGARRCPRSADSLLAPGAVGGPPQRRGSQRQPTHAGQALDQCGAGLGDGRAGHVVGRREPTGSRPACRCRRRSKERGLHASRRLELTLHDAHPLNEVGRGPPSTVAASFTGRRVRRRRGKAPGPRPCGARQERASPPRRR